jgi:hypothetical protein
MKIRFDFGKFGIDSNTDALAAAAAGAFYHFAR